MVAKGRSNARESPNPKGEVGEIDTRAPFQSVKDAVSLFGEGAFSGEKPAIRKPKPYSAERVLAKESQLHLAEKELNKFKEKLKSAETTKAQALSELEKVNKTVEDLKTKLKLLNESKELAIKATEAAKTRAIELGEANTETAPSNDGSWKLELESARAQYGAIITELDAAKQELTKIRHDRETSLEAKVHALSQKSEADSVMRANKERSGELLKEISATKYSIEQSRLESERARQERLELLAGKDVLRQSHLSILEDSAKRLALLKRELEEDPEISKKLESALNEIGLTQNRIDLKKSSESDSVKMVSAELDEAKESLQRVAEEEISLRNSVEVLRAELEKVKREHLELKEKEAETESIAGNLHEELRRRKSELEYKLSDESKARNSFEEMASTISQLSFEAENSKKEAEETQLRAEELKKEVQALKISAGELERNLELALREAEEAKEAEKRASEQVKALSEETNMARTSISESETTITISKEEFESLSRKAEESERVAGMKVEAAVAQAEAVRASEEEALKRLEAARREIEDADVATREAERRAEMAEAARRAVEAELRRWREREKKKAEEAAERILAESKLAAVSNGGSRGSPAAVMSPESQGGAPSRLDKEMSFSTKKKKALMPNLSGIFNRKRSQIEGGSPSYLPGERPI